MATFPKSEMEIATLAENTISGFTANSEVYPAPVIPVEQLQNVLNELKSAQHQVLTAIRAGVAVWRSHAKGKRISPKLYQEVLANAQE